MSVDLPLRSVSQLNQYVRCPQAYKLGRIDKVWARPAAWLPQGTAFHAAAELHEVWLSYGMPLSLEEAQDIYRWFYAEGINDLTTETPNFEWWFWSGPYGGERDVERRYHIGLEQVEKFMAWRECPGQEIWITPDGTPAIELAFVVRFGDVMVRGYIDAVVVVNGELRVRDYKTGNTPGDDFQLGVYARAIESMFPGVKVPSGDYFMAGKKGKPAKVISPYSSLDHWTHDMVSDRFAEVEEQIQAGKFEPLPEPSKCGFCDVNYSCPVFTS